EHGKSQLNLGHLVDGQRQQRGEGVELRTDNHAVIRGGKGIFITADRQDKASGKQLDMQAALSLLDQLQAESKQLAQATASAKAEIADLQAQSHWLANSVKDLQQAALVLSAPVGIALATPSHINLSAGQTITQRSGNDHHIIAGKRFLLAAKQGLSMFAQQCGMKLFASKGKIEIQAHSDEIHVIADKDMMITSVNGKVEINAKEAILLKCGGSYLRIGPLGIESGTLGDIHWKADKFSLLGPTSLAQEMNSWKHAKYDEQFGVGWGFTTQGSPAQKISMVLNNQGGVGGATNAEGQTAIQKSLSSDPLHLRIVPNK
ncbi:uncharacterized protein (DUF2345 family), partial [Herbaspirillum sp. Sphag1AN]|uniref:DUF2345 domain-containing protein n=1 Tax=unclassified Herbaspirillum TaxID=2624150 RepID=UPI00161E902E